MKIKKSLENNISKNKNPFPKVFVTDQSLALLNSMMETFNNCTMNQYLEWSYDILIRKIKKKFSNTSMPIYAYLCASHFLKNIISQANELLSLKKQYKKLDEETLIKIKVKEIFIYSFTLLQNSVNIEDFNNILCDMYYVLSSKAKDTNFQQSFERISHRIYLRDNSVLFDLSFNNPTLFMWIDFKFISRDVKAKIKEKSPFNTHYELILHGLGNTIETNSDPKAEINEYYFPELLNIIKKRLYMMPLWSGVLVFKDGPIGRYESHFTNNPVEVSFHHKRYSTLQMSKKGELKLY